MFEKLMVKKNKIVWFAKFWEPSRQHFGFYEDWRNFGNPHKIGKLLKLGVVLILRLFQQNWLQCDPGLIPNKESNDNENVNENKPTHSNLLDKI